MHKSGPVAWAWSRRRARSPAIRVFVWGLALLRALRRFRLWAHVHVMLADQLSWRRAGVGGGINGFLAFVHRHGQVRHWPANSQPLRMHGEQRIGPRLAYAWLAVRAGLHGEHLQTLLFA